MFDSKCGWRPIEACIVLLPILEFVQRNRVFPSIFVEGIKDTDAAGNSSSRSPLPHTILSLSSYLLTHATSTASSRAIGYSNVALHILLNSAESDVVIRAFCEPSPQPVRLCRQVWLILCSIIALLKKFQRGSQSYPFLQLLVRSSVRSWIVAFSGFGTTCTSDLRLLSICKWHTRCETFNDYPAATGRVCGHAIA